MQRIWRLWKTVREVGDEFAASDDPKAFAKNNRFGKITDNYRSVAQLLDDEAEALANGKQYGPVLKNDTWTMTRVVETLNAPIPWASAILYSPTTNATWPTV